MRFLISCIFYVTFVFGNLPNEVLLSNKIIQKQAAYSIVFVHIGSSLPNYLAVSIAQARLFNKNAQIFIIANQKAFKEFSFIKEYDVSFVPCESLTKSKEHELFIKNSVLKSFWKYTTERFFYLDDFINQYDLTNVFHIENDIMLYIDLEKYLPIFTQNYSQMLGATFDNDQRCIAGFVYISNKKPITELCKFLASEAKNSLNDMIYLSNFKDKYHKIFIDHLPILFTSYIEENELSNLLGNTTNNKYLYCNNFEKFNSIFDAAAIGQYLGGIHCNPKLIGFVNERCLFSPNDFSFEWIADDQNRLIPYIIYKNEKYRINNLHIHSKNLQDFYSLR